jgi:ribonuclease P protein component
MPMSSGSEPPVDSVLPQSGGPAVPRATLHARQRLRRTAQFQAAYEQNRRWHGRCMVLFLYSSPEASMRLGVVASKRVGNAVHRARAKRRLREAFRRHRSRFTPLGVDVVLVARRSILAASWDDVVADLLHLARQAGLDPAPAR